MKNRKILEMYIKRTSNLKKKSIVYNGSYASLFLKPGRLPRSKLVISLTLSPDVFFFICVCTCPALRKRLPKLLLMNLKMGKSKTSVRFFIMSVSPLGRMGRTQRSFFNKDLYIIIYLIKIYINKHTHTVYKT